LLAVVEGVAERAVPSRVQDFFGGFHAEVGRRAGVSTSFRTVAIDLAAALGDGVEGVTGLPWFCRGLFEALERVAARSIHRSKRSRNALLSADLGVKTTKEILDS